MTEKLRILVVDEQETNRHGLIAFLELSADIEVTHQAANGCEALAILEGAQPRCGVDGCAYACYGWTGGYSFDQRTLANYQGDCLDDVPILCRAGSGCRC